MNINISLTINIFKQLTLNLFKQLTWTQVLRFFDYGLLLYITFSSIMALVGICAYLVDCVSIFQLPLGFEDSVLQMNSRGSESSSVSVPGGTDEIAKSMMGLDIDLAKFYNSILSKIANYLNYIFEPVQHSFTIDIMSNHIQNISLLLFILTAILLIFFISFLFNVTLFIFSDRLLSYFTNKYILWYLKFNKKLIAFEIIILSCWIGYLLFVLLKGLHYLATHPVIYSNIGG